MARRRGARRRAACRQVPEYIKLSDEIGDWAGDIEKAKLPDAFLVDYVRVYDVVDSETADDPFKLHAPPDAKPPAQGKHLQELNVCNTNVTDAGLEHLKGLNQLQRLVLVDTKVTDEGVKRLQQALPNCQVQR